jgi:PIN domain nuclease of toxin-antitoxin system
MDGCLLDTHAAIWVPIIILPIETAHLAALEGLSFYHRDRKHGQERHD